MQTKGTPGRRPRLSTEGTRERTIVVRIPAALHTQMVEFGGAARKSLNRVAVEAIEASMANKNQALKEPTPQG